jgi:hypothetical protein
LKMDSSTLVSRIRCFAPRAARREIAGRGRVEQLDVLAHAHLVGEVRRLDHVVIAVLDWDVATSFHPDVIGAEVVTDVGEGRVSYRVGSTQLTVHGPGVDLPDKVAQLPVRPGNSDLCFLWDGTIQDAGFIRSQSRARGSDGAQSNVQGQVESAPASTFRDPDRSLIESISYEK